MCQFKLIYNETDHKLIITAFFSLFFVVAQEQETSNINIKNLATLRLKIIQISF